MRCVPGPPSESHSVLLGHPPGLMISQPGGRSPPSLLALPRRAVIAAILSSPARLIITLQTPVRVLAVHARMRPTSEVFPLATRDVFTPTRRLLPRVFLANHNHQAKSTLSSPDWSPPPTYLPALLCLTIVSLHTFVIDTLERSYNVMFSHQSAACSVSIECPTCGFGLLARPASTLCRTHPCQPHEAAFHACVLRFSPIPRMHHRPTLQFDRPFLPSVSRMTTDDLLRAHKK